MTNQKAVQSVIDWLNHNQTPFIQMADQIWRTPELAFREFQSSRCQADYLAQADFEITWDIGGVKTAFIAEWGQGKPVIGFIGEYDALPGLSQKVQASKEALEEGAPGHGCGHNLLGTGGLAGAVAVRRWLEESGTEGVVRYYGCPAEERGSGKVFMARDGVFDDLDAGLNFHPGKINMASKGTNVGVSAIYYRFYGRTAHAGGSPHEGRSALDAVELMNVGVNYLREHVKDDVRMHYIITEGGKAPNIVPEEAEVYYYIRAAKPDYLAEVVERVRKVAEGAAMMTETRVDVRFEEGCSAVLSNHYLADLQYRMMEQIGPLEFTAEETAFAQAINDAFLRENSDYIDDHIEYLKLSPAEAKVFEPYRDRPLINGNFPSLNERVIGTGSTDVGDVSQITPVSMLVTTCYPSGSPGHSWANVASGGMSIGHKGMMHAAKIMAATAVALYSDPAHLAAIREEHMRNTGGKPYVSPIPANAQPPQYEVD